MGETVCSPSCAGRPCGRQQCATVLLVQEVHHHRHQRLRRHHPPRRQRLLPTLTWQMSVMPATRESETTIIQGPSPEDERRQPEMPPPSPKSRPQRDRQIAQTTSGSTFTSGARLILVHCSQYSLGTDRASTIDPFIDSKTHAVRNYLTKWRIKRIHGFCYGENSSL